MNILILGSGGREHALGWKLAQSSQVDQIFFFPGNGGTLELGKNIVFDITDHAAVLSWVQENDIQLVIVGSDDYLAQGIVDSLQKEVLVFGPTKAAAEIEWSKSFAKRLMQEEGIPTALFKIFSDIEEARTYITSQKFPLVIKADGLALGKGVTIAQSLGEAEEALLALLKEKSLGKAGESIVIEEYLEGKEISIHAFCSQETAILFPSAQDHKRAFDNDKGPNTGGMGTIVPVPGVTEEQLQEIKEKIVIPTLQALKRRGRDFSGVLFPGIMFTKEGPKVIEFNARFGDPETQSYMRLLETDLLEIILACIKRKLSSLEIKWKEESACCIIAASAGYPGKYDSSFPIQGLDESKDKDIVFFQAGTTAKDGKVLTNGGRVLGATSVKNTLEEALESAYKAIGEVQFEGIWYRKDIGKKSHN